MLKRDDWELRLAQYLALCQAKKFHYGSFDCCIFAAGAIDAQMDTTFVKKLEGTYRNFAESARKLLRLGFDDVFDAAQSVTRLQVVNLSAACTGDIVGHAKCPLYPFGMLGVVNGYACFFPGTDGLKRVRLDQLPLSSRALEVR